MTETEKILLNQHCLMYANLNNFRVFKTPFYSFSKFVRLSNYRKTNRETSSASARPEAFHPALDSQIKFLFIKYSQKYWDVAIHFKHFPYIHLYKVNLFF